MLFCSSIRRHTRCALVTGVQTCALPISYLVFVVPLLVESGRWRERVDRICVVDCDPATQVARVQARSGLTEPAIRRIMAAQAARATRLAAADDVIVNDGAKIGRASCRERVCQYV